MGSVGCSHFQGERSISRELSRHLPYSLAAVLAALGLLLLLTSVGKISLFQVVASYHFFHPVHLLLSAGATTAMFWQHDRKAWKAVLVGFAGTIPVCSFGDILLPFLGGVAVGAPMELHICVWEEPFLVFPAVLLGVLGGIAGAEWVHRSTLYSHAGHVLVSSLASTLYLVSYGYLLDRWVWELGWILPTLLLAVMVPCCFSDIVFPLLFVRKARGHPEVVGWDRYRSSREREVRK